jgi:RNA polymerase-associated protein CTR9
MGNICLSIAREMRREEDKEKRRKTYERAVEFFDRALSIDPKNAYAAQGVGIAIAEDKRDLPTAVQIFSNVRETMKDATVYMNLGHVFCELKQFSRAIENVSRRH